MRRGCAHILYFAIVEESIMRPVRMLHAAVFAVVFGICAFMWPAYSFAQAPQERKLFIAQVDVRPLHRSYTIHLPWLEDHQRDDSHDKRRRQVVQPERQAVI